MSGVPCTHTPGVSSRAPGAGEPPSAARNTSVCACRYFSGVPMSIQYASLGIA